MSFFNDNAIAGASGQRRASYPISRSLRFNSADSAVLSRTFGTPTTQNTFTLSLWIKRAALGTTQQLFGVSTNHSFGFTSGNALNLTFGGVSALTTTAVFRDPSAWYHIVWRQSGTSHTLYVNGTSVGTATATSSVFNTAVAHQLGAANSANYFNGYLTEVHFIDGQALDPTSFGEFSATTGVWMPKAFTGSYGTNGFKLDFADNSAATAAALGKDTSGNGLNWTPTNLSVTAGAGNDSLIDVPVNGSQTDTGVGAEVRGNYCTLNPLQSNATGPLANGNLEWGGTSAGNFQSSVGTVGVSSGKWYAEFVLSVGNADCTCGIARADNAQQLTQTAFFVGGTATSYGYYSSTGNKFNNASGSAYGNTYNVGDVIGVALDADNGTLVFYKNGVSQGTAFTGLTGTFVFGCTVFSNIKFTVNFGQRPFVYTAPSGFKALCTATLPAPTIVKPSTVMDVVTYTGTGSTLTPTSSLGFSPDLVWIKSRSAATDNTLYDVVRGAQSRLESNNTDAEVTSDNGLTAFNSAGFTLGTLAQVNTNAATYAAWTWDAGSSTVTNTAGTITSSVRANASAGCSVVGYTGTGANATVGHGLGVAPSLIIVKCRSAANDWAVYHAANTSDPKTDYLLLNSTAATADDNTYWNDTAPTSTVFSIGTNADVNTSTATYIAYCFAPVAGYSAFGSHTGNGSADGSFVYTGMRSRWIIIKRTDTTSNWTIIDTAREGYNVDNDPLYPNLTNAEGTTDLADILSNGFKLRSTDASVNASSGTYVYAAFSEAAFQYSRAR